VAASVSNNPPSRARKSVLQTNVGGPLLLLAILGIGGYVLYARFQAAEQRARPYSPTTTSFAPGGNDNSGARAGQTVVNEMKSIPDGQGVVYKVPAGHYNVRVTANNDGIKARWVGVACYTSPTEQKVYETTCDPAADVQFIVENPTTLGLGPNENVTITITTR
jgi:hypothetical protein